MQRSIERNIGEWLILAFVAISVLVRGGKGLESVWLLALIAVFVTLQHATATVQQKTSNCLPFRLAPTIALAACALWTLLSFLFSKTANYGLDEVLMTCSLALIYLWVVQQSETHAFIFRSRFLRILLAAVAVATLVGIGVYVFQPVNRFTGTFFDWRFHTDYWPNAWAECLLLALPLTVWLYEKKKSTSALRDSVLITLFQGLLLGALLLSYSRGALLALLGAAGIGVVFLLGHGLRHGAFRQVRPLLRWMNVCVVLGAVLVALGVFAGSNAVRSHFFPVQSVSEKVTFTAAEGTSSIDERSEFWKQSLRLSADHPLMGYGPYSFRFVQPQLATGVLATSDHPHNVILKYAMERGWPAALFLIAFLLCVLGGSAAQLYAEPTWKQEQYHTLLLWLGVIAVLLHNMIDYNLQFVGIALPLWIGLGLLEREVSTRHKPNKSSFAWFKTQTSLRRIFILLSLVVLITAMVEGMYLAVSSVARHAQVNGDTATALKWYGFSEHQRFSRDNDLSEAMMMIDVHELSGALLSLHHYRDQNAFDPRVWKLLGIVQEQMGQRLAARESFEKAYRLGKWTDAGIAGLLLENLAASPRDPNLTKRHDEFIGLFTAYNEAILRNTHFIAFSRNAEQVRDIAELLASLYPGDAKMLKAQAGLSYAHALRERNTFVSREEGKLW